MLGSALEYLTGGLRTLMGPHDGWSISCTMPRALAVQTF
jgi:hypothetical protein